MNLRYARDLNVFVCVCVCVCVHVMHGQKFYQNNLHTFISARAQLLLGAGRNGGPARQGIVILTGKFNLSHC